MGIIVLRVLGAVGIVCGLALLFVANMLFDSARLSVAQATPNPAYSYQIVRTLAELRAVPSGQEVVIFGHIADDAPTTTFTVRGLNDRVEEKQLALYRLYTYENDTPTPVREEKPAFTIALEDGAVPLLNTDYAINFAYFSWKTVDGPWITGQEPGGQVTVLGTVESVDGTPALRATDITDNSPDDYTPSGAPQAFDMLSASGSILALTGYGVLGLGLLLLALSFLRRNPRPSTP